MAVIMAPSVPPILSGMFSIPNVALQNTMACRVYRLLKLGRISDDPESFTMGSGNVSLPWIVKSRHTLDGVQSRRSEGICNLNSSTASTFQGMAGNNEMVPTRNGIDEQIEMDNRDEDQFKHDSLV